MVQIVGKYHHESNENLDEYFKGVGVPFIPRKLILASHPEMIISLNDDTNEWTISTNSLFRITQITFKLGIEYEEQMPSVTLKVYIFTFRLIPSRICVQLLQYLS